LEAAPLRDRFGWIIGGGNPAGEAAMPLAGHRDVPAIVLLGERGIGKSDVLATEYALLQATDATCDLVRLQDLRNDDAVLARLGGSRINIPPTAFLVRPAGQLR